jgi:DNA-binding ferritin-like protein
MDLSPLAQHFRAMQLYAHNAHHLVSGPSFYADHPWLGELYGTYEEAYDETIEHMVGLGGQPELFNLQVQAAQDVATHSKDKAPDDLFETLLEYEKALVAMIDDLLKAKPSNATANLLQDFATESVTDRQAKMVLRLK